MCAGFPDDSDDKESACNPEHPGSIPGSGRWPGEGNGYPSIPLVSTLVFLPGEFYEQRRLVGYSPRGHKELDTIEQLILLGVCVCAQWCRLFVTPWTVVHQVPLSLELSRQEYWNGLLFPTAGDLPNSGKTLTL